MEAIVLKTSIEKAKRREEQADDAKRRSWHQQAGVKAVTAKPPEGGW